MPTYKFTRECPECGLSFVTTHSRKLFCTPEHKKAHGNRQIAEGQRIISLAKAWRAGRSIKDPALRQAAKDAFSQLCRELDVLVSDDTFAGRMQPTKLFHLRERLGLLDNSGVVNRPKIKRTHPVPHVAR